MSFSIKELEALSGIKAHTIRIWEQRYSFLRPSRTQSNIRTYSNDELKTILTVALLNKYGYKISKIDGMGVEQRKQEALKLRDEDAQKEQLVNELVGCMIDLDSNRFEEILISYTEETDIFTTISSLVFTFLEKVGILWQTGRISPAHEHIATSIIRQKLISAIDKLPLSVNKGQTFLLFLPEDEHHELGLLFVYYLLKKQGLPTIYLGANVPVKDVLYVIKQKDPAYLYLHLTSFPGKQNFQKYMASLSQQGAHTQVLLSGSMVEKLKKPLPQNLHSFQSLSSLISFIDTI